MRVVLLVGGPNGEHIAVEDGVSMIHVLDTETNRPGDYTRHGEDRSRADWAGYWPWS